jgi:cell division ATPase FtsA
VEALIIAVDTPFLQNIIKCLNIAGIELEDAVFSGIATARCVFPKEPEAGGIVLVEADSNFTALSVFCDNILSGVDVYDKNIFQDGALEYLRDATDRIRGTRPISKIIITGSSFLPEEIIERLEAVFRVPSQIGYPRHIKGSAKDINNPVHITSMGLALYGLEKRRAASPAAGSKFGFFRRVAARLKSLFNEYF